MTEQQKSLDLVVCAPTFYPNVDDLRYKLGIEACREAAKHKITLVLVDASPSEEIRKGLEDAGEPYVKVYKQKSIGKKGVALREAIQICNDEVLSLSSLEGVIAFMELEKVDLMQHWPNLVKSMKETNSDVTIPKRSDGSFRNYYPIEQYHSENFVNMYLDCLARENIGLTTSLDWTCGPVAFRKKFVHHWLEYKGELWDVQLVPLVNAYYHDKANVSSYEVDYKHPKEMKQQEEKSALWCEKRLFQINTLKDTVGSRMIEIKKQMMNN